MSFRGWLDLAGKMFGFGSSTQQWGLLLDLLMITFFLWLILVKVGLIGHYEGFLGFGRDKCLLKSNCYVNSNVEVASAI